MKTNICDVFYDKEGIVYRLIYKDKLGSLYLRSIYPNDTFLRIANDEEKLMRCQLGVHYTPVTEDCELRKIPKEGAKTINKCHWYCSDGTCFLHGALCTPQRLLVKGDDKFERRE